MRYEVYGEEKILFRKFWNKDEAWKFLQPGWTIVVKQYVKPPLPTPETHGEARW